jgi:hypothetical protein
MGRLTPIVMRLFRRCSSGGFLHLQIADWAVGVGPRDQDAVEADNLKNFAHMATGPRHCEGVASLACIAVKRNEGGKTSGINAIYRAEIERHALADDGGRKLLEETLFLPADELPDSRDDVPGDGVPWDRVRR